MKNIKAFKLLYLGILWIIFLGLKSPPKDFHLVFGSGFRNDTVSLEINSTKIIENTIFNSDPSTGHVSSVYISYDSGFITYLDSSLNLKRKHLFDKSRELKLTIIINGLPYTFLIDTRKGRNIVISKHLYYYNVYVNQYKKNVIFE